MNDFVDIICLQHIFFVVVRHGLHPLILGSFSGIIFFPRDKCICPSRFRRFLLRLKASTGWSVKEGAILSWVCSIPQCLLMILLIGGKLQLKVVVNGVLLLGVFSLSVSRASRGTLVDFIFCAAVLVFR